MTNPKGQKISGTEMIEKRKQTSRYEHKNKSRKHAVWFFRDGDFIMEIEFSATRDAEYISNAWNNGCTQGGIATMIDEMGIKL